MQPVIPDELQARAAAWNELHRWERKQLGLALRSLGLSYGEIQAMVPVPKSTLSTWFAGRRLTDTQVEAIKARTGAGSRRGIPVDTQAHRRAEIAQIRNGARRYALWHLEDAAFVAGVVLYWGEGSKTRNFVDLTNSDPAALRLFVTWCRMHLDPDIEFTLSLNLHEGNDEQLAMRYWRDELHLPDVRFGKSFIKPRGTGHRKNRLPHGVCRVRTHRAADNWNRVMTWIDVVRDHLGVVGDTRC